MLESSSTRRFGTAAVCLALALGTTGCAGLVGAALQTVAAGNPAHGPMSPVAPFPGRGGVRGLDVAREWQAAPRSVTSPYQRGPALGWERFAQVNRGYGRLPISSMAPTASLRCESPSVGLTQGLAPPGMHQADPQVGNGPIQRARAMSSAIQDPYYRPTLFSIVGDGLVSVSVTAADPRCGHSIFASVRLSIISQSGKSSPVLQYR